MGPPAVSSSCPSSSWMSWASAFSISSRISWAFSRERSAITSAASSGGIRSMTSAACSLSMSVMRSACTSGSSSWSASAAVSRARLPPHPEAAQDPAHPPVHVRDAGGSPFLGKLDVVYPDDLRSVDVDDLLVQEVLPDEQLVVDRRKFRQFGIPFTRGDDPTVEDAQILPRKEKHRLLSLQQKARRPGKRSAADHSDVAQFPDLLAQRVEHRLPEDVGYDDFSPQRPSP